MNDFEGLLSSDFGLKPQGKAAPMSSNRPSSTSLNFDLAGSRPDPAFASKPPAGSHAFDDFGDLFAGSARKVEKSQSARADSSFDFDSMFKSSSSQPIYDKPVYDDDIFEGVPGLKTSSSSAAKYDHVFEPIPSASPSARTAATGGFDDLLGGFRNSESELKSKKMPDFDDLIPGFGGTGPSERPNAKSTWSSESRAPSAKTMEDPLVAPGSSSPPAGSSSGVSVDPLEDFSMFGKSRSTKDSTRSVSGGAVFDDLGSFDGLGKPIRPSSPEDDIKGNERNHLKTKDSSSGSQYHFDKEQSDNVPQNTVPTYDDHESNPSSFNMSSGSGGFSAFVHSHEKHNFDEPGDMSHGYEENIESSDEVWLTVSEIPLFTQPTRSGPPSRPPPPRPVRAQKFGNSSFDSTSAKKGNEFSPSANSYPHFEGVNSIPQARTATIDDFEDFAMGRSNGDNHGAWASNEGLDLNSDAAASAAAMKEAMDKAEAKFRHAKEMRERESSKAARVKENFQPEGDENWLDAEERALRQKQERLEMERLQRERDGQERERRRMEKEREKEEMEKEQQRLERERERARQLERERARQVVERANREARERAASEARLKAERAAVEKANAEARERANRAAVLRAQTEARERAAAEAKERAERAAAEARTKEAQEARARAERAEKAAAEAREKEARERAAETRRRAERAAVERAAAEARERAAAEARERAAASTRAKQQSNENDLESFFSMGRASSAPRPRANHSDPMFDTQSPSRKGPEATRTTDSTPNMRKASSSVNIVDDLSSIFGAQGGSSNGDFQEVEGETEERRRARLERHQRTQERAAKALAEKNQRDLQAQREQAERHRISETLDVEIKRWSAGKEGNLRSLLATLQYVLWPECGWQPVSLTDLITAAAVKKVYRKATLCIHPDKVQQKGANLQQKYVAEKVFDLLKEAWNKFNSEELF